MRLARRGFAFAALAALALATACGSDSNNGNTGTAQDLSGTYTVTKFEAQVAAGGALTEIPGVEGTFQLTDKDYTVQLTGLPVVGTINDTGTYTAIGTPTQGTFTQSSSSPTGTQARGTYEYNATTGVLVLSTTVNTLQQRVTVQKQGT